MIAVDPPRVVYTLNGVREMQFCFALQGVRKTIFIFNPPYKSRKKISDFNVHSLKIFITYVLLLYYNILDNILLYFSFITLHLKIDYGSV